MVCAPLHLCFCVILSGSFGGFCCPQVFQLLFGPPNDGNVLHSVWHPFQEKHYFSMVEEIGNSAAARRRDVSTIYAWQIRGSAFSSANPAEKVIVGFTMAAMSNWQSVLLILAWNSATTSGWSVLNWYSTKQAMLLADGQPTNKVRSVTAGRLVTVLEKFMCFSMLSLASRDTLTVPSLSLFFFDATKSYLLRYFCSFIFSLWTQ